MLLVSYEDSRPKLREGQQLLLETLHDPGFAEHRETYLGRSRHRVDLAILRDPFNFFASRLKILEKLSGFQDLDRLVANWTDVARRALDPGESDPFVVRFNSWRTDESYRRELCIRIHGEFSDRTLDQVADFGGGSSFEGLRHAPLTLAEVWSKLSLRALIDPREWRALPRYLARLGAKGAGAMDVFGRWKHMDEDERFRGIFARHPDLLEISEEIFGPIPGTREFVRDCARGQ
ncbi:MAG: hypothetical protein KJO11_02115 [Gemmatimonadetes bacterium]|nr:hypothetical protein [Gemmatimonadota bacterium]